MSEPLAAWALPPPFSPTNRDRLLDSRIVSCQPRADAIEDAHTISMLPEVEGDLVRLVFYVDGSIGTVHDTRVRGPGAYSVVYGHGKEKKWEIQAWFVERMFSIQWGEMMAIAEAINMAILRLRMMIHQYTSAEVYILSDSASSLEFLVGKENREETSYNTILRPLRGFIARACRELTTNLNTRPRINFIPGHDHNIGGHILADKMAYATYAIGRAKEKQSLSTAATLHRVVSTPPSAHATPDDPESSLIAPSTDHCSIWSVLHHRSVSALAEFEERERLRCGQTLSSKQENQLRRLRELLGLPKRVASWRVKEIQPLMEKVGHLLPASEREQARFSYNM